MTDGYGRTIDYLRISLTDKCNLRCRYCMPAEGVPRLLHEEVLTLEEISRLAGILSEMGIRRIRLTGGEPLVRKGVDGLVKRLGNLPEKPELMLTTNGLLLSEHLEPFYEAGLRSVNISLDTRNRETFRNLSGVDGLAAAERSIEKAVGMGMNVKLNCVPISGVNDGELAELAAYAKDRDITVRFIELMPIGCGGQYQGIPGEEVLRKLEARFGGAEPEEQTEGENSGPAEYYRFPGFRGKVGLIRPLSHGFCGKCNRIRLTVDGRLKLCLYYPDGPDLRALLRSGAGDGEIRQVIEEAVRKKPERHAFGESKSPEETRNMVQIGG